MHFVINDKLTHIDSNYHIGLNGGLNLYVGYEIYREYLDGTIEIKTPERLKSVKYFECDSTASDVINFIDSMFEYDFIAEVFGISVADMATEIYCELPWENLKTELTQKFEEIGKLGHETKLYELV